MLEDLVEIKELDLYNQELDRYELAEKLNEIIYTINVLVEHEKSKS